MGIWGVLIRTLCISLTHPLSFAISSATNWSMLAPREEVYFGCGYATAVYHLLALAISYEIGSAYRWKICCLADLNLGVSELLCVLFSFAGDSIGKMGREHCNFSTPGTLTSIQNHVFNIIKSRCTDKVIEIISETVWSWCGFTHKIDMQHIRKVTLIKGTCASRDLSF